MKDIMKIIAGQGLKGDFFIPGDKSISHRSVMFSALGDKPVRIKNFLNSQDCLSTVKCIQALGVKVDFINENEIVIYGKGIHGLTEPSDVLDAGNSGTTLRLMIGILAAQPFFSTFTGDQSLRKRPMRRVINPLSEMKAKLVSREDSKYLPLAIIPVDKLQAINYAMPMASAQVKSAILLAGMYAEGETIVTEPYTSRDHTERMFETFGVKLRKFGTSIGIKKVDKFVSPEEIVVPGDISSAAFWLVAASIIPNSKLIIRNIGINPTRTGILDVLKDMGANIEIVNEKWSGKEPVADFIVRSAELKGVTFGAEIMPRLIDEIPILTVAAMFAEGDTIISGAGELRVKETDRLAAIEAEFTKMGAKIQATDDGLIIHGKAALKEAECYSYHDHRIAMALAIAGMAAHGVTIQSPHCVDISYPNFYTVLNELKK